MFDELDPVKSGAEALKAISEAVKIALDAVYQFIDRRHAARAAQWDHVKQAAGAAKALVEEHVEIVRIVTAPVRKEQDIASTIMLLRELVDTSKFPIAYDAMHGALETLFADKTFHDEAGPTIRSLRVRLAEFQYAAFMVPYSSWAMTDALEWVVELVQILRGPESSAEKAVLRLQELRGLLDGQNAWWQFSCHPGRPAPEGPAAEPNTAEEMVSAVRGWLKSWFEHVQQTLYGREGINRLATELEKISSRHE